MRAAHEFSLYSSSKKCLSTEFVTKNYFPPNFVLNVAKTPAVHGVHKMFLFIEVHHLHLM